VRGVLRAVGSEAELPRLQPGGDLAALAARAGALAGAGSAPTAVAAVGLLRAALWDALVFAMEPLDAATTAALAQRVAFVGDVVAVATVAAYGRAGDPGAFVVRDARGEGAADPSHDAFVALGAKKASSVPVGDDWRSAAERHVASGRGFALLAIEVDDAQRLAAADREGAAASALARVEQAVRAELRPGDVMGREEDGRLWVVAAELGATGGRALAERLADAVAAAASLHGASLTASIGIAASPAEGTEPGALAARADEALFAARAAGVPIA
jgi:GGDEF domain-containing protein